jgi:hypothetical protein
MTKRIEVLFPGSLSAEIDPPWACTRLFAIARPSPDPRESAERAKRTNTWASSSAGMPSPVSVTLKATSPPSRAASMVIVPPGGGVTQRVRYEVGDDLTDPDGVDVDDREVLLGVDDERDTGVSRLRAEGGFGGLEQLAGLDPLPVEPERSRLGVREQL